MNEKRFEKKQIHPAIAKIDPDELEENDFILDWQRGVTAHRYCHYTDDDEVKKLMEATTLVLEKEYTADGKSGNLNFYQILRKPWEKSSLKIELQSSENLPDRLMAGQWPLKPSI